jgi:DNA modification methylase
VIACDRKWSNIIGDDSPLDITPLLRFPEIIIWGANNFTNLLPSRGWLIWDKRRDQTSDNHGDAELAWSNIDMPIRIHRQIWRGIVREGEENLSRQYKYHPTQKPVRLMRWCISFVKSSIIIDPYAGSASTCLAAKSLNWCSIAIEIDPNIAR